MPTWGKLLVCAALGALAMAVMDIVWPDELPEKKEALEDART